MEGERLLRRTAYAKGLWQDGAMRDSQVQPLDFPIKTHRLGLYELPHYTVFAAEQGLECRTLADLQL